MRCLVLEDDIELNETICQVLSLMELNVSCFSDGNEALKSIEETFYDIYILDVNVPNINGLDLLRYIKTRSNFSKVLIISSNTDFKTIEQAYELGAYDYLKKPFYIDELRFKLTNIQKEFFNNIKFNDNLFFNTHKKQLIKDDQQIKLTKKELALLNLLIKNKDHIISKDEIIEHVFDNQITNDVNIRAVVKRLREKITTDHIVTVSGIGYRLELNNS